MRLAGIDTFRVIAILAVIAIHTRPFGNIPVIGGVVDLIERFAIPYFFVISGFLYGKRIQNTGNPIPAFRRFSRRISLIFIFWCAAYLLAPKYSLLHEQGLIEGMYQTLTYRLFLIYERPLHALLTGTAIHLWFLPALYFGIAILTIGIHLKQEITFLSLAILMYVVGLIAGPYSETQFGIAIPVDYGMRILFSPIFVISGFVLSKNSTNLQNSKSIGILMIVLGIALLLTEAFLLWYLHDRPLVDNDFLLGSIPYGLGVAMLAISLPTLGSKLKLATLGQYTLGIYCIHVLVINSPLTWTLEPYIPAVLWSILKPLIAYVISLGIVVLMAKSAFLRKVVI